MSTFIPKHPGAGDWRQSRDNFRAARAKLKAAIADADIVEIPTISQAVEISGVVGVAPESGPAETGAKNTPVSPSPQLISDDPWSRVQAHLRQKLGDDIFFAWFKSMVGTSAGDTANMTVPTKFRKSWIESHFSGDLLACWRAENQEILNIEIKVGTNVRFEKTTNRQTIESPSRRENKSTASKTPRKDVAACEIFLHRNAWANWISADDRAHGSVVRVALLFAARYVNQHTGEVWPGWGKIASEAGLSRSSVARAIRWMQNKNYLEKTRPRSPASSARYRLTLPSLEQWVAAQNDRENLVAFPQIRGVTAEIRGVTADLQRCQDGPNEVSPVTPDSILQIKTSEVSLWQVTPKDIERLPRSADKKAADASDEALDVVSIEDWLRGSRGAA